MCLSPSRALSQARKKESTKAKKKRKKEKQKEKKKANNAGGKDGDDDDDDDDDDDKPPETAPNATSGAGGGGGATRGTCTACSETSVNGKVEGKASHKQVGEIAKGAKGAAAEEDMENKKLSNGHLKPRAATTDAAPAAEAAATKKGKGKKEAADDDPAREGDGSRRLSGLAKLVELGVASKAADDGAAVREAWPELPEAVASHVAELEKQVHESHAIIRSLVELCVAERDAKEGALREAEAARRLAQQKIRAS